MGRKIPIGVAVTQRCEMRVQQLEMQRFFVRHPQPIGVIRQRHADKPVGGVEREVDRIEFDMRQRMYERGAPGQRVGAATRYLLRRHPLGLVGTAGLVDR